ncbi:MAG TPA: aroma-sacti cluster domain-containing protein [Edaphobacter sp.]
MSTQKSNIERLTEANILNADHFSDHDRKAIENISPEEIDVLIKLRKKLGEAPAGKEHMRPNFPV